MNEDEQSISIEGKNYNRVQWISNGKIIAEGEKIDLIAASQNIGCYVRAQLLGKGGICLTQAFVLDDGNMHEVTLRNITPRLVQEDRMPGITEVAPFILASSFASWQDVADWFIDLAKPQWRIDEAIQNAVRDILLKKRRSRFFH